MTSLGLSYKLLRLHFKVPNIYRRITCCVKGSYTLPHLISIGLPKAIQSFIIFFQNFLIRLFYVLFQENIFCVNDAKSLFYTHEHSYKTKKLTHIFSLIYKTIFLLGGDKFISCSHRSGQLLTITTRGGSKQKQVIVLTKNNYKS
jgi:hypothetical protein